MADSWHQDRELDSLPKSELNPLVNPLLERHLGRWAEVYFTSPPEKREQAIEELLEELEREDHQSSQTPAAPADPVVKPEAHMVCRDCQQENIADQRFCGNCGAPLADDPPFAALADPPAHMNPGIVEMPSLQPAPNREESDLQWLRGRASSHWEESGAHARGRRLLGAGLGLVLLLAGFGGLYWVSHDRTAAPLPAAALQPPAETQPALQSPESPVQNIPAPTVPAQIPQPTRAQKPSRPQPPSVTLALSDTESGSQELRLARRSLDGETRPRDSATAARLLWRAVGKQNTQAALLLSDLYVRGDGVPRNCDQARLLLVAAAKKGGTSAAQQLRNLDSSGCR